MNITGELCKPWLLDATRSGIATVDNRSSDLGVAKADVSHIIDQ